MRLDERTISRAIIERYTRKLLDCLELDVAVVGGGPSGLVAAHDLAAAGRKVALFERKLSLGGGMWGGGMMMNEIVVQEEGRAVLERFGIRSEPYGDGYHTADSVECVAGLCAAAVRAGARLFNLVSVEDVTVREERVVGLVVNWTAVEMGGLHVDPLTVSARQVIDATGHDTEIGRMLQKQQAALRTASGRVEGQRSLWADRAEQTTMENTRELFPGVFVTGMCANASFGGHRMGPIFGGMLLSGEKVARLVLERLDREAREAQGAQGAREAGEATR